MSADPLGVHVPGQADWNLYAYVRAQLLRAIDPLGLQEWGEEGAGNVPASESPVSVERVGGGGGGSLPEEPIAAAGVAAACGATGPGFAVCAGLSIPGDTPIPEKEIPAANRLLGEGVVVAGAGHVVSGGLKMIGRAIGRMKAGPAPSSTPMTEVETKQVLEQLDDAEKAAVQQIEKAGEGSTGAATEVGETAVRTPHYQGPRAAPRTSDPNSIRETRYPNGNRRVTYYDEHGNPFSREDYGQPARHVLKVDGKKVNLKNAPHEHQTRLVEGPNGPYPKNQVRLLDETGKPTSGWVNEK